MQQLDMDFTPPPRKPSVVPGVHDGRPVVFGAICPPDRHGCKISTAVWRYCIDEDGKQTTYIKREKGRPVCDIAADLETLIKRMNFEWATLGQPYKYKVGDLTPETECPDHNGIAVYVTHGGSEGHLVHVEIKVPPSHGEPGFEASMRHTTLFMVKTFAGPAYAQRIATKIAKALGVL